MTPLQEAPNTGSEDPYRRSLETILGDKEEVSGVVTNRQGLSFNVKVARDTNGSYFVELGGANGAVSEAFGMDARGQVSGHPPLVRGFGGDIPVAEVSTHYATNIAREFFSALGRGQFTSDTLSGSVDATRGGVDEVLN